MIPGATTDFLNVDVLRREIAALHQQVRDLTEALDTERAISAALREAFNRELQRSCDLRQAELDELRRHRDRSLQSATSIDQDYTTPTEVQLTRFNGNPAGLPVTNVDARYDWGEHATMGRLARLLDGLLIHFDAPRQYSNEEFARFCGVARTWPTSQITVTLSMVESALRGER